MSSDVTADNRAIWERLAPWWDDLAGDDGPPFHREVIRPTVLSLLEPQPGERVLDAGCGNGSLARHFAQFGLDVVAFDQAETFISAARSRSDGSVDYRVIDGTDPKQLATLAGTPFDAAVAVMVLMDMPDIVPLFAAVAALLRPGGRFVLAVIHPCFGYGTEPAASPATAQRRSTKAVARAVGIVERMLGLVPQRLRIELVERAGAFSAGMASLRYLDARQIRAQVAPDQPLAHWYFHRPLHALLNPAFETGLVLDRLAEPPFWDRNKGQTGLFVARLRRRSSSDTHV